MNRYFAGSGHDLGHVSALPCANFAELCAHLRTPVTVDCTRVQFHAAAKPDRDRVKRVNFLTPAVFDASPAQRRTERAQRCNLIALDVDDPAEGRRLRDLDWAQAVEWAHVVWHTASSMPHAPRLRVLVAADGIRPGDYQAAARTVAEQLGMVSVTSQVVFHAVQPMFLPTRFTDDPEDYSPFVSFRPEGDAFASYDIAPGDEDVGAAVPGGSDVPDGTADVSFLRAPLDGVELDHASSALAIMDPDLPMQQWIEIAAGLKHQFGDAAYQLWDQWSSKGAKYPDAGETRYRWDSLKGQTTDRAPVTIRSLFRLAQARGWVNPALAMHQHTRIVQWLRQPSRTREELMDRGLREIAQAATLLRPLEKKSLLLALRDTLALREMPLPLADIKKALRDVEIGAAKSSGVPTWCRGLCYVTALNVFYRHATNRRFMPEVFDLMYAVPAVGDDKPLRPRDYAVQIAAVPQVENLRYDPAQGTKRFFSDGGVPYVNTYRADHARPTPETADDAGEVLADHLRKLIREPQYAEVILDYLAFMVQHPGRKIRWAILLQGAEGCGKTFLSAIMRPVLGPRNCTKLNGSHIIDSAYNDWAVGRQLVAVEEVRIVGANRHAVMDKLKPCITDDEVSLNRKFEPHALAPNNTNYLMFTNHHDALAVTDESRRFFVLASPLQRAEQVVALRDAGHFARIYAAVRDNPGGFRSYFERRTLSASFAPDDRAPVTPYLREMAEMSASPLAAAVREAILDAAHPLVQPDLVSVGVLRRQLDPALRTSDQALAAILREGGWTKRDRCLIQGERHQLWAKGDLNARLAAFARAEI